MNIKFRLRLPFDRLLYMTLVKTEMCIGFNSNRHEKDSHFIFMDIDDTKIGDLIIELSRQQQKYDLGEIYLVSDKNDSFQVWCFKQYPFKEMMSILLDNKYTNLPFIRWTARKGCSTMRIGSKKGRGDYFITKLDGRFNPLPHYMEKVIYETVKGSGVTLGNS